MGRAASGSLSPVESCAPDGDKYYRLVNSFPPTVNDFHSYRMLFPERYFPLGECIARSVSIFSSYSDCDIVQKLPHLRGRIIVEIILTQNSGAVLQTTKNKSHFSWWRVKTFDPLPCCTRCNS